MFKGTFTMAEGKPSGRKYFCCTKNNQAPCVLLAESDRAALTAWAGITGRKESEGKATPIGTQAKTITHQTKPLTAAASRERKAEAPGK